MQPLVSAQELGALKMRASCLSGLTCARGGAIGGRAGAGRVEDAARLRAPARGPKVDEVLHELGACGNVSGAQRSRLRPNACNPCSFSGLLLMSNDMFSGYCQRVASAVQTRTSGYEVLL